MIERRQIITKFSGLSIANADDLHRRKQGETAAKKRKNGQKKLF